MLTFRFQMLFEITANSLISTEREEFAASTTAKNIQQVEQSSCHRKSFRQLTY